MQSGPTPGAEGHYAPDARAAKLKLVALFGVLLAAVFALDLGYTAIGRDAALVLGIGMLALYGGLTGRVAFVFGSTRASLSAYAPQILSEIHVGVVLTDAEFRILHANPAFAQMLGREPQELAGTPVSETIYGPDRAAFQGTAARRKSGLGDTYRIRLANRAGRPVHVMISAKPVFRDGQFSGTIGLIEDLTERVAARARAAESENLSGFLFDAIAHDLSNSLVIVIGRLAAASALAGLGGPRSVAALGKATTAAERAARELKEIKQIARAGHGGAPERLTLASQFVRDATALAEVEPAVEVVEDLALGPSAEWISTTEAGPIALAKLIEEAVAQGAGQPRRRVVVELRAGELGGSTLLFRVHGCGKALPLDDLAAVLHSASSAPQGEMMWRSGVRLVLAATIAKPMGWRISAAHEPDGGGTVFELRMTARPGGLLGEGTPYRPSVREGAMA